jgi:hypothetical protein
MYIKKHNPKKKNYRFSDIAGTCSKFDGSCRNSCIYSERMINVVINSSTFANVLAQQAISKNENNGPGTTCTGRSRSNPDIDAHRYKLYEHPHSSSTYYVFNMSLAININNKQCKIVAHVLQ